MSRLIVVACFWILLGSSPAHAVTWSIGTHLGLTSLRSDVDGSGSTTVVGGPSNALTYQPGLRVGLSDKKHGRELIVDSGFLLLEEAGSTSSFVAAAMSYQHTFLPSGTWSPFANLGIGLFREGGAIHTSTLPSYGFGAGMRHRVREDHGALRGEVRFDRLKADHRTGRPTLYSFGLRLGFDLWL